MNSLTRNRLKLVFIAALFALPVISAWVVYKNPVLLEGGETKNYGELISPAIPSILSDYISNGAEVDMQYLKGRWVLLHIDLDGKCDEQCEKSVHMLRQLNVLLNKDSERLKRVYLNIFNAEPNKLLSADSDLNVYPWTKEQVAKLNSQVKELIDGDMLLIDPLGNIMMKYHQDADPYGIQKDLKLLFKASQIG